MADKVNISNEFAPLKGVGSFEDVYSVSSLTLKNALMFIIFFISDDTLTFGTNRDEIFIAIKFIVLFLLTCFLSLKFKNKILPTRKTFFLYLFMGSLALTSIFRFDFRGGYLYQAWILVLAYLIAQEFIFSEFIIVFNKFLYIVSSISLASYLIVTMYRPVLGYFPIQENYGGTNFTNLFLCGFFENTSLVIRNTSIFREPGVFVIFILFGIIGEFFWVKKMSYKNLFIFITALFTTFSTAGFFILLLLVIGHLFFNARVPFRNKIFIVIILISVISLIVLNPSLRTQIFSKLDSSSTSYGSAIARLASVIIPWQIFIESPLFGSGLTEYSKLFTIYSYNYFGLPLEASSASTNTITSTLAVYGSLGGGLFIFSLIKLATVIDKRIFIKLILATSFLLMFSNEDMRYSLFFLVIIFLGLTRSKTHANHNVRS